MHLLLFLALVIAARADDIYINCGGLKYGPNFIAAPQSWIVGGKQTTQSYIGSANISIGGSEYRQAWRSYRYAQDSYTGKWGYNIPVSKPGVYNCTALVSDIARPKVPRSFHIEAIARQRRRVKYFDSDAITFTNLVVTQNIQVLLQKTPKSKHSAIINGLVCRRVQDLTAGIKVTNANVPRVPVPPAMQSIKSTSFSINCGGKKVGKYLADNSDWYQYGPNVVFTNLKADILGTSDANEKRALRTAVFGKPDIPFGYQIPVQTSGLWQCHLVFSELLNTGNSGSRIFDVQIQNQKVSAYNMRQATQGGWLSVLTFVKVPVHDTITIFLNPIKGIVTVNAIECILEESIPVKEVKTLLGESKNQNVQPVPPISVNRTSPNQQQTPGQVQPTRPLSPTNASDAIIQPDLEGSPEVSPEPDYVRDVTLEKNLTHGNNDVILLLPLGLSVPKGTQINDKLKEDIKSVVSKHTKVKKSNIAIIRFEKIPYGSMLRWVSRLFSLHSVSVVNDEVLADSDKYLRLYPSVRVTTTAEETSFEVDVQYQTTAESAQSSEQAVSKACKGDECSKEVRIAGCTDCTLKLIAAPTTIAGTAKSGGLSTGGIVAIVVGSLLAALLLIAGLAFVVLIRSRNNEMSQDPYGAPPSFMGEESDGFDGSPSEITGHRSSIDYPNYPDDDSTTTAVTSHRLDPESGITVHSEVWDETRI